MSKHVNGRDLIEKVFMWVFFAFAFVAASVAALVLIGDRVITTTDLSMAGVALGTTGVWIALGFFLYEDRKRKENDEIVISKLKKIRKTQKKYECRCQADCCGEADAQEPKGRSRLLGTLCSGARR